MFGLNEKETTTYLSVWDEATTVLTEKKRAAVCTSTQRV